MIKKIATLFLILCIFAQPFFGQTFVNAATANSATVSVSPTSASTGETKNYTFTFTNNDNTKIGSVRILIPANFTAPSIVSITPQVGKTWHAVTTGGYVNGYNSTTGHIGISADGSSDEISNNSSVTVVVSATAPNTANTYQFTSEVFPNSSTPFTGTAFAISPSQPTVQVTFTKLNPVITWSNPADLIQGLALDNSQLNAVASVPGTFTYTPVSGTILAVGTNQSLLTNFTPTDTATYNSASSTVFINVIPGSATTAAISADHATLEAPGTINLTITLKDTNGNLVANGTQVNLSSDFGTLVGSTTTTNGVVTRTLSSSITGDATLTISGLTLSGDTLVHFVDTTAPIISLIGSNTVDVWFGSLFTDLGATAFDLVDLDLTTSIVTVNPVDTNTLGKYSVTYNVSDAKGNAATQVTRTVNVIDVEVPIITLVGNQTVNVEVNTAYTDAGATALDNADGSITGSIITTGLPIDTSVLGTNTVRYNVADASLNNATEVTRTVIVEDTTAPVVTVTGNQTVDLKVGETYTELGATASDNFTQSLIVTTTGSVDTQTANTYTVTYSTSDSSGNNASASRTVNVRALGTDSSLLSLTTSEGTLSPSFASSTLSYTALLAFDASTTPTTTAIPADGNATFSISNAQDVTSSNSAFRTTSIEVTAENGSKTTYAIVFSRASTPDTTAPVITILGNNPENILVDAVYTDAGATSTDDLDGDVTSSIITDNQVNTKASGTYSVIYTAKDKAGNNATSTRSVVVSNPPTPPSTNNGGGGNGGGSSNFSTPFIPENTTPIAIESNGATNNSNTVILTDEDLVPINETGPIALAPEQNLPTPTPEEANPIIEETENSQSPATPDTPATQTASIFDALGDGLTFGTGYKTLGFLGLIALISGFWFLFRKKNS